MGTYRPQFYPWKSKFLVGFLQGYSAHIQIQWSCSPFILSPFLFLHQYLNYLSLNMCSKEQISLTAFILAKGSLKCLFLALHNIFTLGPQKKYKHNFYNPL